MASFLRSFWNAWFSGIHQANQELGRATAYPGQLRREIEEHIANLTISDEQVEHEFWEFRQMYIQEQQLIEALIHKIGQHRKNLLVAIAQKVEAGYQQFLKS